MNGLPLENINDAILAAASEAGNEYAMAYAKAAMEAASTDGTEGLAYQISLILCNAGRWRGERARKAKSLMRQYLRKKMGLK